MIVFGAEWTKVEEEKRMEIILPTQLYVILGVIIGLLFNIATKKH